MAETGPDDRAQAVDEVERQLAGLVRRLRARGVQVTVRDTRGREIDGACGQLAAVDRATS